MHVVLSNKKENSFSSETKPILAEKLCINELIKDNSSIYNNLYLNRINYTFDKICKIKYIYEFLESYNIEKNRITKEKIEELKLPGIDFIETQKRNYPYGRFLSYTLGYAKLRTEENENGKPEEKIVGELGIEAKFDKELSGTDGYNYYQKDRNGYKIAGTKELTEPAKDGNNIYLTIDASIQLFVEQAISKALDKYDADWMTIMVANAKTGAILASSTYPTFDPNLRDMTNYLDYNISYAYEPGSTMKIFSYMATMENGNYDGNATYRSGVYITKDGTEIGDWNRNGWGDITFDHGFVLLVGFTDGDNEEIIDKKLVTRMEHAAYLGSELQKAQIAMITGKEYVQDFDLFKNPDEFKT